DACAVHSTPHCYSHEARMLDRIPGLVLLLVLVPWLNCASPPDARQAEQAPSKPAHTLVMATRVEPPTLASRPVKTVGVNLPVTRALFNATLTTKDEDGRSTLNLAASSPQLNTDTWRVFADGQMETIYHLQPSLVWHDGGPLTADDFVFGHAVYTTPDL